MKTPKYVPRFRHEQESWIARARAAPTQWAKIRTAKATTQAIVEQLQATAKQAAK